jgi:hypothetical protein
MALTVALVAEGILHSQVSGQITVGAGYGQVAALGANQLLKLLLPYNREVYRLPGFKEQIYVLAKPLDSNVSAIALDATQFENDPATGAQVLRLRVDISAVPASVQIWIEAHHSTGR